MKYSWFQDGGDFYVTSKNKVIDKITAPMRVVEGDIKSGIAALDWFKQSGYDIIYKLAV